MPLTWDNALPFAGDLLKGLSGFFGNSGPGLTEQANRQLNYTAELAENYPSWVVEGARRAGLHPLTALGINPASGPSFSIAEENKIGDAMSYMGQGLHRAAQAQMTTMDRLQQRLLEVQIEG